MSKEKDYCVINSWIFLWYWFKYWNILRVIDALEKYSGKQNFQINFCWGWKKFYILQNNYSVKKIMQSKTNELTYINSNFNISHGHFKSINCFDSTDPNWTLLHNSLKRSLGSITDLLHQHQHLLFDSSNNNCDLETNSICLNHNLERFLLTTWAQFCFGPDINIKVYTELRQNLLSTLYKTYYDNPLTWIPGLGKLSCHFLYWWHKNEFKEINSQLELDFLGLALQNQEGFFYRLEQELLPKINDLHELQQIMIDNAFLSILVYDFLEKVILDFLLRITTQKLPYNIEMLTEMLYKAYQGAFLYPIRYRQLNIPVTLFDNEDDSNKICGFRGDVVLVNLKKAGLYFSWGPRSCVGQTLFKQQILPFFQNLLISGELQFVIDLENKPNYPGNGFSNVPDLTNNSYLCYPVQLTFPRNYLLKNLRHYDFKGVKYYQILALYENQYLFHHIIESLSYGLDEENLIDALISPEVRGLSLAGAMAYKLKVPLYTIRKKGKLPGPVHSIKYDMAYSQDTIEFSSDVDLTGKKLVLVDDGIASGGTALACLSLIEKKMKAHVVAIRVAVNHTYCLDSEERISFDNHYGGIIKTMFDL